MTIATDLHVNRIDDEKRLAEMADEWNALAGGVPFRRHEWLATWWRHFRSPTDGLFVLAVRDAQSELIGLAPWYVRESVATGRVVRFLGSGDVCSDYMTILTAPDRETEVVESIARHLLDEAAGSWHALQLSGVTESDTIVTQLMDNLSPHVGEIDREPGLNCWRIALPATWDEYVATLSKSRRERVRRLWRRQFETGRAVCRYAETPADLEVAWPIFVDLHQRRRRSLGQSGCFACSRFDAFLRDATERFLAIGRLRLQWIELEGRPVAVEFDLAGDDTVYYYQSGIDPASGDERPGWLGAIGALRRAIDEGFAAYDFLRGDEAYKSHWRGQAVSLVEVRVAAPGTAARCRHQLWQGSRQVKRWAKQVIRRKNAGGVDGTTDLRTENSNESVPVIRPATPDVAAVSDCPSSMIQP